MDRPIGCIDFNYSVFDIASLLWHFVVVELSFFLKQITLHVVKDTC